MTPVQASQQNAKKAYEEKYSALVGHIESIVKMLPNLPKDGAVSWGDVGDMDYLLTQARALDHIMRGIAK